MVGINKLIFVKCLEQCLVPSELYSKRVCLIKLMRDSEHRSGQQESSSKTGNGLLELDFCRAWVQPAAHQIGLFLNVKRLFVETTRMPHLEKMSPGTSHEEAAWERDPELSAGPCGSHLPFLWPSGGS